MLQANPHRPFTAAENQRRTNLSAYLDRCSEDNLIEEVLLPLFRQLGFHRITAAGHTFVAETHPDAPDTVAAFLKLLPYRQKLIHVRWSGEGCWIPLGEFRLGVGFENHTSHPSVGDILFYPGGYSETEIMMMAMTVPDRSVKSDG